MASLIPGFEYDIFISYRHKDNKGVHWVTEFANALKTELDSTFKEDISIYFDENPRDGLLETHNVDKSLEGKLKSLILIPIISQTYCDAKSFAWKNEFCLFNKMSKNDHYGRDIKLSNGNVASRILPVKIHDLDATDKSIIEAEIGGILRAIEFVYKEPGVNRPLKPADNKNDNQNKTDYRNQVNKVANAIKEIINALKNPITITVPRRPVTQAHELKRATRKNMISTLLVMVMLVLIGYFLVQKYGNQKSKGDSHSQLTGSVDKSIAVLPFLNLSNDPEQEYFSDGLTEELINVLSKLPTLKVIGRTSSFQFKNQNRDLREIGKQLGVSTILEGSVRRSADTIRITVQMIDANDGTHFWSETYDRRLEDVLKIQDEIALAVVSKLSVSLLETQLRKSSTVNKEALDYFLKARFAWNNRKLKESEYLYTQSIQIDTSFALAYSGLAETYMLFPFFRAGSTQEYYPKAQKSAEKAFELDESLPVPVLVMASKFHYYDLNPDKAREFFKKAITLDPGYSPSYYFYGQFLNQTRARTEEVIATMNKAIEVEPFGSIPYLNLGSALMSGKKYDQAVTALQRSLVLNNQNSNVYLHLGTCYLLTGQMEMALNAYKQSASLSNDRAKAALVNFYMQSGDQNKAQAMFDDLYKQSKSEYVSQVTLAIAASFLKKKDLAYELLKKAFESHDAWIPNSPLEFPVRQQNDLLSDPRNVDLLKKYIPQSSYLLLIETDQ